MSEIHIRVPRLGEGIEKVKLTRARCQVGQYVARDEIIAEVETDKANMEIESPFAGAIVAYAVRDGDTLHVGDLLLTLRSDDAAEPAQTPSSDASIFRIDRAIQTRIGERVIAPKSPTFPGETYRLPPDQATLAAHLRDSLTIATATVEVPLDWDALAAARRRNFTAMKPSTSELICFAVARTLERHPALRCVRRGASYFSPEHTVVGYAVGRPDDGLFIARATVPKDATFDDFIGAIRLAQSPDRPYLDQPPSLIVSDLSSFGVVGARPVVVAPSVATLFVGAPETVAAPGDADEVVWRRRARLVLAFDHGLINGVGASAFLHAVSETIVEGWAI